MTLTVSLLDTDDSPDDGGCVLDATTAAQGTLLLAQISHDGSPPSAPSGWTLEITQEAWFSNYISTYSKYAAASETSYTFTHLDFSGGVLIGVADDTGTPTIDFITGSNSGGSAQTSFAATGGTMSAAGVIVATWMQVATGSTLTKPASMTSLQTGDIFRSQCSAYESVSSGATGTRTATATGNNTWGAVIVGVISVTGGSPQDINPGFIDGAIYQPTALVERLVSPDFINTTVWSPIVTRGGMDPILVGTGSLADRILEGLISQGFLTGSIADRERQRLLAKLLKPSTAQDSLHDLYVEANEPFRLLGVYGGSLP